MSREQRDSPWFAVAAIVLILAGIGWGIWYAVLDVKAKRALIELNEKQK